MALFSPTWSGTCAVLAAILWSPIALLLSLPSLVISAATSPVLLLSLVLFDSSSRSYLVLSLWTRSGKGSRRRVMLESRLRCTAHHRLGEVGSEHGSTKTPGTDQQTMRRRRKADKCTLRQVSLFSFTMEMVNPIEFFEELSIGKSRAVRSDFSSVLSSSMHLRALQRVPACAGWSAACVEVLLCAVASNPLP